MQPLRDFIYIGNGSSPERQPMALVRVIYGAATGVIDLKTLFEGVDRNAYFLVFRRFTKGYKVLDFFSHKVLLHLSLRF
jgi:hypothetical protein